MSTALGGIIAIVPARLRGISRPLADRLYTALAAFDVENGRQETFLAAWPDRSAYPQPYERTRSGGAGAAPQGGTPAVVFLVRKGPTGEQWSS